MAIKYPNVTVRDILASFQKALAYHRPSFYTTLIGVVIFSVAGTITPIYYKQFIDTIAGAVDRQSVVPELLQALLIILGFNFLSWVGFRLAGFFTVYNQSKVQARIRQNCFEYLLHHSYGFFSDNFSGSITQRVSRMARAYERITDRFFWQVLPLVIRITGTAFILWQFSPSFTWILLGWIGIICVAQYGIAQIKLPLDIKSAEEDSRVTGYLADTISNSNTVQLFNKYEAESKGFWGVASAQSRAMIRAWNIGEISTSIQSALIFIAEFGVFFWALQSWAAGEISIGVFVLLQLYFLDIGEKLWGIGSVIRDLYQGYADSKEMVEMLMLPHEVKDTPLAKPLPSNTRGEIEFENATFSFNQTREVLSGFNLTINSGEKVALIGPSGAGKSTFVRLLLRLYNLASGKILIDGQDIAESTLASLRENIAFVPQDPSLFHRSLMENIRYGKENATDEEVITAAKLAHCDEFIAGFPLGYQTLVGERGVKLSGGERQRVAIARAILRNAPILILDEATSSLDSHSESLIQEALEVLMKGKTTIVIAHRLSTIRKMDRIIVIEEGKVLEEGTHETLVEKEGGLYKKLWNLQAGGFLAE